MATYTAALHKAWGYSGMSSNHDHLTSPPREDAPCKALGGADAIRCSYLHSLSSSHSSRISGKRSRSNSPESSSSSSSSSNGSPPADGSSASSSVWSFASSRSSNHSVTTPPSPSSESDNERGCPSPLCAKRKAVRCHREQTAGAASLRSQIDNLELDVSSALAQLPYSSSSSSSSSSSATAATTDSEKTTDFQQAQQAHPLTICTGSNESASGSVTVDVDVGVVDVMKEAIVDHLVAAALQTIHVLWYQPLSLAEGDARCTASGLPLHLFVRETLRRSRTSCSTLQAALLYCLRCAPAIGKRQAVLLTEARKLGISVAELEARGSVSFQPLLCARRIFLASIMVAAKFLQDKTFSNRAWSKITGLPIKELANVEREFLAGIQWDLNVSDEEWKTWTARLAVAKAAKLQMLSSSSGSVAIPPPLASTATALPSSAISTAVAALKVGRSTLARSHSNDVAATSLAFDTLAAGSPPSEAQPSVRAGEASALAHERNRDVQATASTSPTPDVLECDVESTATPTTDALSRAKADPPAPFPMPRAFVRNAASFNVRPSTARPWASADRSGCDVCTAAGDSG